MVVQLEVDAMEVKVVVDPRVAEVEARVVVEARADARAAEVEKVVKVASRNA